MNSCLQKSHKGCDFSTGTKERVLDGFNSLAINFSADWSSVTTVRSNFFLSLVVSLLSSSSLKFLFFSSCNWIDIDALVWRRPPRSLGRRPSSFYLSKRGSVGLPAIDIYLYLSVFFFLISFKCDAFPFSFLSFIRSNLTSSGITSVYTCCSYVFTFSLANSTSSVWTGLPTFTTSVC